MKEIEKDVEQLEEASQQLSKQTPTGARLALLLLDNLVELLMYKKVRLEFARYNQYQAVIPLKYSPKKQKEVMDYFGDKVNFLVSETKAISQDEGDCLKIAHHLRNEAYHTGILRRSIIIQVTKIYFEVICGLLPRLWIGRYMCSSHDEVTTFLKKYNIDLNMIDNVVLSRICNSLLGKHTCSVSKLSKALSLDLLDRIGNTLSGLDYLAEGSYERTTAKAILKGMQFFEWLANNYEFPKTDEGFQLYVKTRKKLYPKYKPPITMDIIKLWKRQAKALKLATMPGTALRKFADIDVKLLPIEQKVSESVYQYDEMINMQIHDR